jgi:hypothetical protein
MFMGGKPTPDSERVVDGVAPPGKVLESSRPASPDPKWTPERRAALRRTIEAARRFVRCADEFVPDDGTWFYPDALGEYGDALNDAIEAEARAWDEDPAEPAPPDTRVERHG